MRKASNILPLVTMAMVAAADKSRQDYVVPFDVQQKSQTPLTDETGQPIMENGQQVMLDVEPIGVTMRQQGGEKIPTWIHQVRLEAGIFHSEFEENRGELVKGANFYLDCYDLNPETIPGVTEMSLDEIREICKGLTTKDMLDKNFLVTTYTDDSGEHESTRNMHFRNYWGKRSGPKNSAQTGVDYPVFIAKNGVPRATVSEVNEAGETTERTFDSTDWDLLPGMENFLLHVYTRYKYMEIPEASKTVLHEITSPEHKGGYTPRTRNAPSLIAEKKMGQATDASSGGTGLPSGTGQLINVPSLPENANALAGVIGDTSGGGTTPPAEDPNFESNED